MTTQKTITQSAVSRRSTLPGSEVSLLHAWPHPSLSLSGDGGPTVSGKACIQFCRRNSCLQRTCTRSEQISVCFLKLHAWEFGLSSKNWPICSNRGRYCDCSLQCYGPYPERSGSVRVLSPSSIEIDSRKVHFWSQTVWILWQNFFSRKNFTTCSES